MAVAVNKTFYSPAKINLYFDIVRKYSDGYHYIITVMHTISLYDKVSVKIYPERKKYFEVITSNYDIPKEANTVYKMMRNLQKLKDISVGVEVEIEKNIPLGSGLGGGSSNAATFLNAINNMLKLNLTKKQLYSLAKSVGSDAPFFINGGYAFVKGKGEMVECYNSKLNLDCIVVYPGVQVLSKDAYERFDKLYPGYKSRSSGNEIFKRFQQLLHDDTEIEPFLFNRFEELVYSAYPQVYEAYLLLKRCGIRRPILSGSGSAVFGIIKGDKEKKYVRSNIEKEIKKFKGWKYWLTRTI